MLNLSKSLAKQIVKQQSTSPASVRGIHCRGSYGIITNGIWLVRFPVPNLTGVYSIEPGVMAFGHLKKVHDKPSCTIDHLLSPEPGPQNTDPKLVQLVLEIIGTLNPSSSVRFSEYKQFLRINVSDNPDIWAAIAQKRGHHE